MLQPSPRSMSRSRPVDTAQWNAHQSTSSSSDGMLSQLGIPPNVTIATFTHQKAPVKKTIPASRPAAKARQGDRRRMARSIGTRQTKASGSSTPEANSSRRGPTGKAMGKAAAPRSPVRTSAPSRQGTSSRSGLGGTAVRAGRAPDEGGRATADIERGVLLPEPAGRRVSSRRRASHPAGNHPRAAEQAVFQGGHPLRVLPAMVVVSKEVEKPMSQVQVQLLGQGVAMQPRLPPAGVDGEDDVAEVAGTRRSGWRLSGGEAEDVGRAVLPAPGA